MPNASYRHSAYCSILASGWLGIKAELEAKVTAQDPDAYLQGFSILKGGKKEELGLLDLVGSAKPL